MYVCWLRPIWQSTTDKGANAMELVEASSNAPIFQLNLLAFVILAGGAKGMFLWLTPSMCAISQF